MSSRKRGKRLNVILSDSDASLPSTPAKSMAAIAGSSPKKLITAFSPSGWTPKIPQKKRKAARTLISSDDEEDDDSENILPSKATEAPAASKTTTAAKAAKPSVKPKSNPTKQPKQGKKPRPAANRKKARKGEEASPVKETASQKQQRKTTKRLRERAIHHELLGEKTVVAADMLKSSAPLSKHLLKCDGGEIKRPRSQKKRMLLSWPGRIVAAPGATLGSLEDLDTQTPYAILNLDDGRRVKAEGTIVYLQDKLLTLECGGKDIVCSNQFDNVVVFSEYSYIGTAEENPTNKSLQFPEGVFADPGKEGMDKILGAAPVTPKGVKQELPVPSRRQAPRSATRRSIIVESEDEDRDVMSLDDDSDEEEEVKGNEKDVVGAIVLESSDEDQEENQGESEESHVSQSSRKTSARKSSTNTKRIAVLSSENGSSNEEDALSDVSIPPPASRSRRSRGRVSYAGMDDEEDEHDSNSSS